MFGGARGLSRRAFSSASSSSKVNRKGAGMQIALATLCFALGLQVAERNREKKAIEEEMEKLRSMTTKPQDILQDVRNALNDADWAEEALLELKTTKDSQASAKLLRSKVFTVLDNYSLTLNE